MRDMSLFAERAGKILASMTVEEKIGQLFLAHCPAGDAQSVIRDYHIGGFVLFARDFAPYSPKEARAVADGYQSWAKIPLILSADEEGGGVVRVSKFPQYRPAPFQSPRELFASAGWDGIDGETREKARLLKSVGVNMNLAPVCDFTSDPDAYIAHRVFGHTARQTARFIDIVVRAMGQEGVGCSLKHFPGYGGNADTHKGMSRDNRPLSDFESSDLLPFIAGINAGADSVMVSHNIVRCFDDEYPSSLSVPVHRFLREKLGYDGVIITDSLTMSAIRQFTDEKDPCTRALTCGNDMIITAQYIAGYEALYDSYKRGEVTQVQLDTAVLRILKMKLKLGIIGAEDALPGA